MRIYTKTGDAGETALFDGTRVSKADPRVDVTATWTSSTRGSGRARAGRRPGHRRRARPDSARPVRPGRAPRRSPPQDRGAGRKRRSARLTSPASNRSSTGWSPSCRPSVISSWPAGLRPARRFTSPAPSAAGPSAASSRSEASIRWSSGYLNRLSDLLFVMARAVNSRAGVDEIEW